MLGPALSLFKPLFSTLRIATSANFHSLQSGTNALVKADNSLLNQIRTKVRCYFPRPNEVKRVRRHGWEKRMSTSTGRRIILRRLLKGRHVVTH